MTRSRHRYFRTLCVFLLLAAGFAFGSRDAYADLVVYGDALGAGWANWSWSATVNFSNTSPVHSGSDSISVTYTGGYGGLYLDVSPVINSGPYGALQFWINGGSQGVRQLRVYLYDQNDSAGPGGAVQASAGKWTQVTIPLSALGSPSQISGIVLQDTTGGAQPTFFVDDISLISQTPGAGPALSIDMSANRHAISQDIYGMNFPDRFLATALNLPVSRWGGNSTTRYNWQTNMYNTGGDWYFENIPDGDDVTVGSASDLFINQNISTGTKTLLTIPLIGWTPSSDSPREHPYSCGFSVAKYGAQQSTDPYDPNCGNGVLTNGAQITGNSPADSSTPITPAFVTGWIDHLVQEYGIASGGGVAYYDLDNEPMLWNSTHRDVHPNPTSYVEMKTRTYQYAAAVKAADPTALTLGPVAWGWCDYFYSAVDGCAAGNDYASHGNEYYLPWYLQQMQAYEQANGVRILDYLDIHYYPQASGVSLSPAGNSATQALRLRSTRALWDPSYIDESWISETAPGGVAVDLIPRMQAWIAANYPGTMLSISEYNWGALNDINGALAQADVLGIFGREGLDLATLWGPPADADPGAFAFRMYRNYDGANHGFGDVSTLATSADPGALAVYAAQRTADKALTVMVINKSANEVTSTVTLAGCTPASNAAAVYQYSPANLAAIEQLPNQAVSASGFSGAFPGYSITLYVIATLPIPSAPANVTATGGNAQATVSFTLPASNGGSPITGYTVTSSPGAKTGSGRPTSTSGGITVTGLTNGMAYTFTVKATNANGPGLASGPSNSVTPTAPVTAPGAPTIGTATAGNAQAKVTFSAPASNGGSPITGYTATSSPGGKTGAGGPTTTSGGITVTGLTNGTAYTFTVKATNSVGAGAASGASNSVTPTAPATAPGAPAIGTATAGNALAKVTFSAPASNGGSPITGYTATSSPGGKTGAGGPTSTSGGLTVTGLTNGMAYTFTVTATNGVGTGAASKASNSVTPATVPGAPTIGTATAGNTQAQVKFTAPASNGGSAITSYTATSNPGGKTGTGGPTSTSSGLTVTGLANGKAYTFTVTATNGVGTGTASKASNSVTPK